VTTSGRVQLDDRLLGLLIGAEAGTRPGRLTEGVLEASPLPVAVLDPEARVLLLNRAAERMFGWTAAELVGQPAPIRPAGDAGRVQSLLARALSGERLSGVEVCLYDKEGRPRELAAYTAPIRGDSRQVEAVVVSWLDIAERKRHEDRLEYLATHDELTDLPNRRVFEESLQQAIRRAARGRHSVLMLIDVDRLKVVNDTAGHHAGDRVLAEVASLIGDVLRPGDLLARIGDDEFAALVFDVAALEAREVALRLTRRVAGSRIAAGGHTFDPTVSVGVCAVDGTTNATTVLRHADQALYTAKELGRNRAILADDERLVEFVLGGRWTTRIKDALDGEGLLLALQPIVQLRDGQPRFYEVLIRMQGDQGEILLPDAFLPTAEQLGLMPQIDAWVVRATLKLLYDQPELHAFVNLSSAGFEDDSLLDLIETELTRVEPGRLGFEITETAVLAGPNRTMRRLETLRTLGCPLALDDFGRGLSSLTRLHSLPVDFLKIDRSLTQNLDRDLMSHAIVRSIVELGHALDLSVIAEGVETSTIAAALHNLGADYGQGFHWNKPQLVRTPALRDAAA
jgi:Amt family ammonium transporter